MLTIDWILIVLWVLGTLKGWARGMVRQAVSIVGIILGFLLAKAFCSVLGATLAPESEHPSLVSGACFVLIWLGVPIALGLVGELMSTVLDKLCILGALNKVCVLSSVGIISEATMQRSRFCAPLREIPVDVYKILASDDEAS